MASIEHRQQGATESWRVVWREGRKKQQETFRDETTAKRFHKLVEGSGNHWPNGWVKRSGFAPDETVVSFQEFATKTINARLRADERTRADYLRILERHVHPHIGHLPVTRVDRFEVAGVAQHLIDAGKAAKTIANIHGLLSSILADAVIDGLIARNPAVGALPGLPDVRGEEMVFLTPAEFASIADNIDDDTNRDLAVLLVGTGLRWSEATALQVRDVDLLGARQLHVRRAWKRRGGHFEIGEPKTKRSRRTLDLSPALVDMLVRHVAAKGPGEFVFTTAAGRPVRHNNYYYRVWVPAVFKATNCVMHREQKEDAGNWRKHREPCGCPGMLTKQPRLHDLRHSQISWLIDAGVSLPEIQRRAGHESIQTTIDRYGHPSGAREAINAAVDRALAHADLDGGDRESGR